MLVRHYLSDVFDRIQVRGGQKSNVGTLIVQSCHLFLGQWLLTNQCPSIEKFEHSYDSIAFSMYYRSDCVRHETALIHVLSTVSFPRTSRMKIKWKDKNSIKIKGENYKYIFWNEIIMCHVPYPVSVKITMTKLRWDSIVSFSFFFHMWFQNLKKCTCCIFSKSRQGLWIWWTRLVLDFFL